MVSLEEALNLANYKQPNLSIGTTQEHTLHKVIKYMFDPSGQYHEIKILKKYVDVYLEEHIYEIQTKAFNNLRSKLEVLLDFKPVTIIYPVIMKKKLIKINDDGEVVSERLSPKKNSTSHFFKELYRIKTFLKHPNLSFQLFFIDIIEYHQIVEKSYRNHHGKIRIDQVPTHLNEIITIASQTDYLKLLPVLPEIFTSKELKKILSYQNYDLSCLIQVFKYLDIFEVTGKIGNAYIYKIKNS